MRPHDSRRLRQFQIRQLLTLTALAALLFATIAPFFRKLEHEEQVWAFVQSAVLMVLVVVVTGGLLLRRQAVERSAGLLIERFERSSSRLWTWVIAVLLFAGYAASIWWRQQAPRIMTIIPGSPVLLVIAVNFLVLRLWWRIDPTGVEACEHGLILGGLQLHRWQDINRYSWSGDPARQLNLFLKSRTVINFPTDKLFREPLDKILAAQVAGATPPFPPASAMD